MNTSDYWDRLAALDKARAATRCHAVALNVEVDTDTGVKILQEAVSAVVGSTAARPREGQLQLTRDIIDTLIGKATPGHLARHHAGAAPTGSGKSFAALGPAMAAALNGERTVLSTESLSLQAQIIDKDAPLVGDACQRVTGVRPTVAVHKGWSNYACARQSVDKARALLAEAAEQKKYGKHHPKVLGCDTDPDDPDAMIAQCHTLADHLEQVAAAGARSSKHRVHTDRKLTEIVIWALRQHGTGSDDNGDKATFTGSDQPWGEVSVASGECLGESRCPLAEICLPREARRAAAAADIVITNHTLLALQTAKGVPVMFGSATMGRFDHLIVDEAHALPAQVRSQGAHEVGAHVIDGLTRQLRRLDEGDDDPRLSSLVTAGEVLALEVADQLSERLSTDQMPQAATRGRGGNDTVRIPADVDPLGPSGEPLLRWCTDVAAWTSRAAESLTHQSARSDGAAARAAAQSELAYRRVSVRATELGASVRGVRSHRSGNARWLEQVEHRGERRPVARCSPVQVAPLLRANLWQVPWCTPAGEEQERSSMDGEEPTAALNVVCISATLPVRFVAEVGLDSRQHSYPSPFGPAYASSAAYIPRPTDTDLDAIAPRGPSGRRSFQTRLHIDWAAEQMWRLVEANRGSALVLAATAAAGRRYAEILRSTAMGRWSVLSQWDDQATRLTVDRWRRDESAVLVGTRSLMTGVDAPGRTCSLVVIDRVPRDPGNPVGDARKELLSAELGNPWSADLFTYVADARLLLEQAAGRLVRGVDDLGMVAVLDPRLPKTSPIAYRAQSRELLVAPLKQFGQLCSSLDTARAWLTARHVGTGTNLDNPELRAALGLDLSSEGSPPELGAAASQ